MEGLWPKRSFLKTQKFSWRYSLFTNLNFNRFLSRSELKLPVILSYNSDFFFVKRNSNTS